jgi:hypothetical protein
VSPAFGASASDEREVTAQLGRPPRRPWRVLLRCPHGRPRVIASPSRLADGSPFPTTFWLTCPVYIETVAEVESAGGVCDWESRLRDDPMLALRARAATGAYVTMREIESGGADACGGAGIGGVRREGSVKCLHARVAAFLAGIDDPVGEGVAASLPDACDDERCRELAALWKELET